MSTGLSFFPVDRIAMLAANDFLTNPTLMVCTYLEWAAAMKALGLSGQLSLSASTVLLEISETVAQTPAACLDYFDAEYSKVDADGEYSGYSIAGHLLLNVDVLDQSDPEYQHLPLMLTQRLAIIQLALKVFTRSLILWRSSVVRI